MINKAFPKAGWQNCQNFLPRNKSFKHLVTLVSANKLGETTALTNFFEISIHFLNKIQVIVQS